MPEIFAIKAYGPDQEKLRTALAAGVVLAQQHASQITILVPALNAADGTILCDILGERFVRNLAKGQTLKLEGCSVLMRSMQTVNPFQEQGVVVTLWGGPKMLDQLDRCSLAQAIVALSWLPEEIEGWAIKRSAKLLGETHHPQQDAEANESTGPTT